ncbi:hypothetical protein L6452_03975 [Arctium lappa]|uniref:Uncharacterized protein n=1 Tax=Arctium lappa TaxID=4217 RepID=A0ACB9FQC5_ARCLA|nr:hypothetical protein L6452_03975 [Arctium lappa]
MTLEILSRTSLKTFHTIVSTNKDFNKLTYDPYFLHLYKQRNNIVSGFLVQHSDRGLSYSHEFAPSQQSADLDLGFLPRDARILATSEQGIMVFESPHRKSRRLALYHVCKPATNQVVALPNPKTRYLTEKVAIAVVGSNPFRYKILRLSRRPNKSVMQRGDKLYSTYCCEIFDSATFAWKMLDDIMLPYDIFLTIVVEDVSVASDGDHIPFDDVKMVKYEGKLSLGCKARNGGWEIWVITGTRMNEEEWWEKKYAFEEKQEEMSLMRLNSFYDSETSVVVDYDTLVFYKFKKGSIIISKIRLSDYVLSNFIFSFRSDFEPVDFRGRC